MWGQPPSAVRPSEARQVCVARAGWAHPFALFAKGWERSYSSLMAVNWLEVAKKMAEDARAQLALNRKRLQEILAERTHQQFAQEPRIDHHS
jgi:hypothetical protein